VRTFGMYLFSFGIGGAVSAYFFTKSGRAPKWLLLAAIGLVIYLIAP